MQPSAVQTWFLVGVLIAGLSVFVPAYLFSGFQPGGLSQVDVDLLAVAIIVIAGTAARLLAGTTEFRFGRRHRPHTLFTPLYDQR